MKLRLSFIICLVVFALLSCGKKSSDELLIIGNPAKLAAKSMDVEEFADSIIYIQIDDSLLLPALGLNFALTEKYMFFLTKEGLLKYDRNGKLLKRLSVYGNGPGEISNFYPLLTMDKPNERLYVFSFPNSVLTYSFEGKFLGKISVEIPNNAVVSNFYYQDDCFYFFFAHAYEIGTYPAYWVAVGLDGKMKVIKKSDKKKSGVVSSTRYGGIFVSSCYNHRILSWDLLNDTVFYVDSCRAEAAYLWGKGDFRIVDTDDYSIVDNKRLFCSYFIDTKHIFLQRWRDAGKSSVFYVYYDKRQKKFYRADDICINNSASLFMYKRHFLYYQENGREFILTQTKSREVEDIPGAIKWEIDPDDPEGNPVLIMIRLKE